MDPCIVIYISKKEPTRCDLVVEFIVPMFINCSTCFGRHTPIIRSSKTVIAASGFTHVFGCRLPLRWLSHRSGNRQPKTCVKPEAAITVFELMMMGGVSPETCWAIKKYWNNKFYYTVTSFWLFLWDLWDGEFVQKRPFLPINSVEHRRRSKIPADPAFIGRYSVAHEKTCLDHSASWLRFKPRTLSIQFKTSPLEPTCKVNLRVPKNMTRYELD